MRNTSFFPNSPAAIKQRAEIAQRSAAAAPTLTWITMTAALLVGGLTVLQRVGVTIGAYQFPAILFIVYGCLAFLCWRGVVVISARRFIFLAAVLALFILSALLADISGARHGPVSYPALIFMIGIYLPFGFVIVHSGAAFFEALVSTYVRIMLVLSLVGLAQFLLQFVGIRLHELVWAVVPETLIYQGFHYEIPIEFRSALSKANGVVFLEPSHYSRALAFAIILEIVYTRNIVRLAVYHAALIVTFSGTGLIVLAIGYPLALRYLDRRLLLASLLVVVPLVIAYLFSDYANLTLQRTEEFQTTRSSGYVRFIGPYKNIVELGLLNNWFFGYGPGTAQDVLNARGSFAPFAAKALFEFGVVPTLALTGFMLSCLWGSRLVVAGCAGLAVIYFVITGGHLALHTVYWLFVFGALPQAPSLPATNGDTARMAPGGRDRRP